MHLRLEFGILKKKMYTYKCHEGKTNEENITKVMKKILIKWEGGEVTRSRYNLLFISEFDD